MRLSAAAALMLLLALASCGSDGPVKSEDHGNLLNSPQGLVLVMEEHPTGWSRPDCFTCHEFRNIHTVNRTGLPDLDLAEIRDVVREQGEESCVQCHGGNGVAP